MWFRNFFRKLAMQRMNLAARRGRLRRTFFFRRFGRLEQLEDRLAPATFTNSMGLAIPDNAAAVSQTINVSGLSSPLQQLRVTIGGLTHSFPQDLDFLLVGPGGTRNLEFWSDAGGGGPGVNNITVSVADFGASPLPSGNAPATNTTYQPADYGDVEANNYFGPTLTINHPPSAGNATFASAFTGINANGVWALFVRDDKADDIGGFTSWSLDIATSVAPTVTTSAGTTAATEQILAAVDTFIIFEAQATLASAMVSITGGFQSVEDVLGFTNTGAAAMGNIAGSFNGGSGVLTLTSAGATATHAQWETALRAVTYLNTSDTPNTSDRTITFVVNDGTLNSAPATKTVSVTAVDDATVITFSSGTTVAIEQIPVAIDPGLTVTDPDTPTLSSAAVEIMGNFQAGQEELAFTNDGSTMGNIAVTGNAGGVLTLTSPGATATLAQWQSALRAVTYLYTGNAPDPNGDEFCFIVENPFSPGPPFYGPYYKEGRVTPVNDSPFFMNVGPSLGGTEQTFALLDTDAAVSDVDLDPLNGGAGLYTGASLTIARNGGANVQDSFGISMAGATFTVNGSNLQSGGLTFGTFTNSGGTLTINFTSSLTPATRALVNNVIQHVTYANTSDNPPASATLNFTFHDGSPGNGQGTGASAIATGSTTVNITALNDAPTLTPPGNAFTTITEDQTNNAGDLVSALIAGLISDVDLGASQGIAVVGTSEDLRPLWEYSTNGGSSWTPVPAVSGTSALLLRSQDLLRFAPDGMNGATGSVTFRAWDQTSGAFGTLADPGAGGGMTAFSTATASSTITVTAVNDAPVLSGSGNAFTTITEDQTNNAGDLVSALIAGHTSDVDSGALSGIAVTLANIQVGESGENWQFSTDGGTTWTNVGTVSGTMSLLLRSQDRVRLLPNTINPPASTTFTYRLWDQSNGSGQVGTKVDTSSNGGTTPYSTGSTSSAITVTAINDAPVNTYGASSTFPATALTVAEDTNLVFSAANGNQIQISDPDAGSGPIKVTLSANNGTLILGGSTLGLILTDLNGDGIPDVIVGLREQINTALSTLTYRGASNFNGLDLFTLTTEDQGNTGSGGAQVDSDSIAITVTSVNDAPTFTRGPNIAITIRQSANTPAFSVPAPTQQTVAGWATNLSAGPGETIVASSPSGNNQTVAFNVRVTDLDLMLGATVTVDVSLATASLNFTPVAGRFGSAVLQVRMTDSAGGESPFQTFVITIEPDRPAAISEPPGPQTNVAQPKVRLGGPKLDIAGAGTNSSSPAVAQASATGDYVAVWSQDAGAGQSNVFFQRYNAAGFAQGGVMQVNTAAGQNTTPAVSMESDGAFIVVWNGPGPADDNGIYARRYSNTGAAIDANPFLVNSTIAGLQSAPAVSSDMVGGFVVVWQGNGGGDADGIFGRRFNSTGAPQGAEFLVNTSTTGAQVAPSISIPGGTLAADVAGSLFYWVAWSGEGAGGAGIYARRFDEGGTAVQFGTAGNTDAFLVSAANTATTTQLSPTVKGQSDNDPMIVWPTYNSSTNQTTHHFQRFGQSGLPVGSTANFATVSGMSFSSVAMDNDGDFVIVWDDVAGVTARRWDVNGAPISPFFSVTTTDAVNPRVASDGAGNFVVVWGSFAAGPRQTIDLTSYASNEAPNSLTFTPASPVVPENASMIGSFTVADNNPDDTFTYTFASDNSNGAFAISPAGVMTVVDFTKFNYETAPIAGGGKGYSVLVRVTDSNGLWRTQPVNIEITDVNEAPTDILLSTQVGPGTPVIPEHSAVGTVVGILSTLDPDLADDPAGPPNGNPSFSAHAYALTAQAGLSGPVNLFNLVGNQLRVSDSNGLEFENAFTDAGGRFYNVTVQSTDGGGLPFSEVFKIYVSFVAEPTITSLVIGDGTIQRSRVDKLTVNFSEAINIGTLGAGAFSLIRTGPTGAPMAININVAWSMGNTRATLTFSGPGTEIDSSPGATGGSLVDGNYSFAVNGNVIFTQVGNRPIDANGDNFIGGTRTVTFFRLFGDRDGNRQTDNVDFFFFRGALGSSIGQPNYLAVFDFDGDGLITNLDLFRFRQRLGQPPLPTSP